MSARTLEDRASEVRAVWGRRHRQCQTDAWFNLLWGERTGGWVATVGLTAYQDTRSAKGATPDEAVSALLASLAADAARAA